MNAGRIRRNLGLLICSYLIKLLTLMLFENNCNFMVIRMGSKKWKKRWLLVFNRSEHRPHLPFILLKYCLTPTVLSLASV